MLDILEVMEEKMFRNEWAGKQTSTSFPWLTLIAPFVADIVSLTLTFTLAVGVRYKLGGQFPPLRYLSLWPVIGLFLVAYVLSGLYPSVGITPPDELRRLSYATTLIFLILGVMTFLFQLGLAYSRAIFLMAWALALILVPLGRAIVRALFSSRPWWGCPVVVLGAGETGRMIVRTLHRNPGLGLHPVAVLDDDPQKQGIYLEQVPVVGGNELAPKFAEAGVRYAILAMPGVPPRRLVQLVEQHAKSFSRLIVIPDLFGFASLWVSAKDFGGVLGLELRQRLLLPTSRFIKRILDLGVTLVGGILATPLLVLIAVLVKLDSPGPVLYCHTRIGYRGKSFKVCKFRSMVQNADQVLREYLKRDPELRQEWERDHKLRSDPRITRMGQFLRKTSLDELPQLWNVLRGEMSLVGPRPIVREEISKYGDKFALYAQVKPGLTGLWQVSGRSDTTYEERVELDAYYVRNWSIWLDIYILARTIWVVLFGKGAY